MKMRSFANLSATWRGSELFASKEWNVRLQTAELTELKFVADSIGAELQDTQRADVRLSALKQRLCAWQMALEDGSGVVLAKGLPVKEWGEQRSTSAFWAIALELGVPLCQSADGERLFHVRDRGYTPYDPRFRGPASRERLSFHTDRCDVIAFACLHQANQGGNTYIVSSVSLYEHLRKNQPDLLTILCEPFPYLRHTVDTGNPLSFCRLPIFSEHNGHFAAHFLRVLIDRADRSPNAPSLSPTQREALDALESLAEDPSFHVQLHLQPGDILLLNNWTTLHRRSAFTDVPGSKTQRHLLRIWLSMPNSRPIAPCFQAHFGNTAPGAIRGGFRPHTDHDQ